MTDSRGTGVSSACIDSATLAAFVDGTLAPADRAVVVAHLATCPDCYEVVAEVALTTLNNEELQEHSLDEQPAPIDDDSEKPTAKVLPGRWLTYTAAGGALALAATVLFFVLPQRSALAPLVSIVGSERLTIARPTGSFQYGPLRSSLRGAADDVSVELRAEAARLRARAAATGAADDLHASGVAEMLSRDAAAAVRTLESAAALKPEDAAIRSDLGAAYMSRFAATGDQGDGRAALDALNQAIARAPSLKEAWFNKALLLEQLNQPADAAAAWDQYLGLGADAGWRDEAVRHRDAILARPTGR